MCVLELDYIGQKDYRVTKKVWIAFKRNGGETKL